MLDRRFVAAVAAGESISVEVSGRSRVVQHTCNHVIGAKVSSETNL